MTHSAADDLVRLIRLRVPNWTEDSTEPRVWRFTDEDPDWSGRFVVVDGREGRVLTCPLAPGHYGPTLSAMADGRMVHVDLPASVDWTDLRRALAVAEAIGALPDAQGMTR